MTSVGKQKRFLTFNEKTHANYKDVQKLEGFGMALIIESEKIHRRYCFYGPIS